MNIFNETIYFKATIASYLDVGKTVESRIITILMAIVPYFAYTAIREA